MSISDKKGLGVDEYKDVFRNVDPAAEKTYAVLCTTCLYNPICTFRAEALDYIMDVLTIKGPLGVISVDFRCKYKLTEPNSKRARIGDSYTDICRIQGEQNE